MSGAYTHRPVLLEECIQSLAIRPDGVYVDGTLGRGGHSEEIVKRLTAGGRLVCIDRDWQALEAGRARLAPWAGQITFLHGNFADLAALLDGAEIGQVDGMLFDLGVSSPQLDDPARGFSYMADAPLDMRMDQQDSLTAWTVVNQWPRQELKRILAQYGEERYAGPIAAAIDKARQHRPIETTGELVEIIRGALPAAALREKQHPAKRSFQGIHRRQRRAECGLPDAPGSHPPAENGGTAGGDLLPLPGGPDRQKRAGRRGQGLRLPPLLPGVRVRQTAPGAPGGPQAHSAQPPGADREPPGPQRQAAGGRKAGRVRTKETNQMRWSRS